MRILHLRLPPNQIPILIPGDPLPPRLKSLLARIKHRERMRFRIKHDLVEGENVVGSEEEVEVLEGFCLETNQDMHIVEKS